MSTKKTATFLLLNMAIITILLLSALNIQNYLTPSEVLGIETQNGETLFWNKFLEENPSYIPGWIEIGRLDKVKQIDPNYFVRPTR